MSVVSISYMIVNFSFSAVAIVALTPIITGPRASLARLSLPLLTPATISKKGHRPPLRIDLFDGRAIERYGASKGRSKEEIGP